MVLYEPFVVNVSFMLSFPLIKYAPENIYLTLYLYLGFPRCYPFPEVEFEIGVRDVVGIISNITPVSS